MTRSRAGGLFRALLMLAVICVWPLRSGAQSLPLPLPALPQNINTNNVINVANAPYNAIGNGIITNTTAIQSAINAAAAGGTTNGLSGGIVEIPAGTFLSGPLTLKSKVNLQIDTNALLQMLPYGSWSGTTTFINGSSIQDVAISGAGTIDGQGAAWWAAYNSSGISRPNFIQFSSSSRILIQNVTLQNPPTFHIMIKNNNANITVRGITINTPGSSPNTDGFDISSTNVLIQNCYVSCGDDNVEIGGSAPAAEVTVTNCTFGTGHGISIGSITSGGVSNVVVANCTFSGTDYGIRLKSDNASSGGGSGGLVQNLSYFNIGMTNITKIPVVIYSYYNLVGTPSSITPAYAAGVGTTAVTSTTVIWRNIVISNLTATVASGRPAGIIWGRTELPVTNVVLSRINITASQPFDVYNATGVRFADSQINLPAGNSSFLLYDARLIVTNSSSSADPVTFDGLTANGYGNVLSLYNTQASLQNTNVLDDGPLTINASTLTISNNLTLFPSTVLNYAVGTSTTMVAVTGNLVLGGTNNISAGNGFTNGNYTLMTYAGALGGNVPTLGTTPPGFNYSFDTSTAGQVKLVVSLPAPPAPAKLTATGTNLLIHLNWNAVAGATSYNLKRGTTSNGPCPTVLSGLDTTNYADAAVTDGVTYFYVVTAVVAGVESTNSTQASAAPLPSNQPANIVAQMGSGTLQLAWPQDHLGWRLQMQTNSPSGGLGTNWVTVPNSTNVFQTNIIINPANGPVFLRLVYP
jgi:polygalacturonase